MINLIKNNDKFYKYIKYFILGIILLFLLFLIFKLRIIRELLNLILISFIFYYILKPVHKFLKSKGINNKVSALMLIIFSIIFVTLVITSIIPSIFKETTGMNNSIKNIENILDGFYKHIKFLKNNKTMYILLDKISAKFNSAMLEIGTKFLEYILNLGSNLLDFAVIPIICYYFLSDEKFIKRNIFRIFPIKIKKIAENIAKDIDKILEKYIISQIFLCALIGIVTFLILIMLKIEFPIVLSLFNAFFNIVPYFGPIIGAIPAVFIAFIKSPKSALWTLILLYLLQQIEGNIICPKVTGESIDMHPLTVILLLTIGGKLSGFVGMILAIPVGVIIKVIYEDLNYYLF
ncbi:AI-2E family transporter [Clostridium oceanicum]|uniref:AI-2E family transporter n=1 Tax=Clostridium oceanicum TaxID=1543 RepID=A0ABP3UHN7_9CLOT